MTLERPTREELLAAHPLLARLEREGHTFRKVGREYLCRCPFHEDRKPSLAVNEQKGTWFCHPCNKGGSVIDFVMMQQGVTAARAMEILGEEMGASPGFANANARASEPASHPRQRCSRSMTNNPAPMPAIAPATAPATSTPTHSSTLTSATPRPRIAKTYDYHDEDGRLLYQAVRLEPEDFRQRAPDGHGGWVWRLDGIRLVPYQLPAIRTVDTVWIVEGEKDADTIRALGFVGTCNPMGAGKWRPEFNAHFRGKSIVIIPDSDDAGEKHLALLQKELGPVARAIRVVRMPEGIKDISEFMEAHPHDGPELLGELVCRAEALYRGESLPVLSMAELEAEYMDYLRRSAGVQLQLGAWLPTLGRGVRPLVPGEVVSVLAGTGVGKTMILQNIALATRLQTLLFEIELPGSLTFERFAAMAIDASGRHVETMYQLSGGVQWRATGRLDHIHCIHRSRLTPAEIERIIRHTELKTNHRPALVLIDYVQLVQGEGGTRYERASHVAEQMKIVARETNTIIVLSSQVSRPAGKAAQVQVREVSLTDAKESGSIENSSGLVLGAWRDEEDKNRLWLRVLKNTKGTAGLTIPCRIRESLAIVEEGEA